MASHWIRYPSDLEKQYYDVLQHDGTFVRHVFPTPTGDFTRGTTYVAGSQVVAVREAKDSPEEADSCPFCRHPRNPMYYE